MSGFSWGTETDRQEIIKSVYINIVTVISHLRMTKIPALGPWGWVPRQLLKSTVAISHWTDWQQGSFLFMCLATSAVPIWPWRPENFLENHLSSATERKSEDAVAEGIHSSSSGVSLFGQASKDQIIFFLLCSFLATRRCLPQAYVGWVFLH